MCNAYRLRQPPHVFADEFSQMKLPLVWADGEVPDFEPHDDIRIRDTAPVIGRARDGVELAMRQWAWLERSRPLFNNRSDGSRLRSSVRPVDAVRMTAGPDGIR